MASFTLNNIDFTSFDSAIIVLVKKGGVKE